MFFLQASSGDGAPPSLKKLVELTALGDVAAFELLFERTRGAAYLAALTVLRSPFDAEDAVQETYIQVFRQAAKYEDKGSAVSWIMTIARNFARMRLRHESRVAAVSDEELERYAASRPSLSHDEVVTLRAALETLSDDDAEIVMLHACEGIRHRDIASLLGIPLGTVLSKYRRALAKLRRCLEDTQ